MDPFEGKASAESESKAAEYARKHAEEKAAAEARRQIIEQDRAAARLALKQMHKTVEIAGSSQFLKEVGLMGSLPEKDVPWSIDENSSEYVFDGFGVYKPGESNPKERVSGEADEEDESVEDEEGGYVSRHSDVKEGESD